MIGNNLLYKIITETPLENGYKIVATDMSDGTLADTSMMIYCVDFNIAYIACKGCIGRYEYVDSGYYQLIVRAEIGRYAYLTRFDKKCLRRYNYKYSSITEEEYHNRFVIGSEDIVELV